VNPLTIETRGKVMIIKINRPQQRNAINKDLSNQLYTTLKSLNAITTSTIAAVVIGSTGEDFCAGYDLKEISDKGLEGNFIFTLTCADILKP
jgi:enoyl-CoA hydratase